MTELTEHDKMHLEMVLTMLQGGLRIVDGHPYIHSIPAIWDEEEPVLTVLSQWKCPHCKSHLANDSLVCLNGCHLTTPQMQHFTQMLQEGHNQFQQKMRYIDGIRKNETNIGPRESINFLTKEYPMDFTIIDIPCISFQIQDWAKAQNWRGKWGIGWIKTDHTQWYGLFEDPKDAIFFKTGLI